MSTPAQVTHARSGPAAPESAPSAHAEISTAEAVRADERKLSYSTLAVALGLAGAGAAWSAASTRFGVPEVIGEILYATSAAWWFTVVVARVPLTRDRLRYFRDDVRHPMTGPFPVYVPIVALLLTMHYALYLPAIATQVLCVVWVSVLVLMSAQMLAFWFSGSLRLEQVHPGYALPVIAGPYIAAVALIVAGLRPAAVAAVGLGTFFWLTLGAVIFVRLIAAPPVPRIASPTMSVIVTLPVTAGLAWFAVSGSEVDAVQYALVGVVVLLLVTQVFLVPTYVRTPFSLGFWAFSFPAAALASYAIRWASAVPGTAAAVVAVLALGAASLLIAGLAAASIARAVASIRAARSS